MGGTGNGEDVGGGGGGETIKEYIGLNIYFQLKKLQWVNGLGV